MERSYDSITRTNLAKLNSYDQRKEGTLWHTVDAWVHFGYSQISALKEQCNTETLYMYQNTGSRKQDPRAQHESHTDTDTCVQNRPSDLTCCSNKVLWNISRIRSSTVLKNLPHGLVPLFWGFEMIWYCAAELPPDDNRHSSVRYMLHARCLHTTYNRSLHVRQCTKQTLNCVQSLTADTLAGKWGPGFWTSEIVPLRWVDLTWRIAASQRAHSHVTWTTLRNLHLIQVRQTVQTIPDLCLAATYCFEDQPEHQGIIAKHIFQRKVQDSMGKTWWNTKYPIVWCAVTWL